MDRDARSARLDVGLKPGFSAFDQAAFSGGVRFADPKFFGTAAACTYDVDTGALDADRHRAGHPRAARRQRSDRRGRHAHRRRARRPDDEGDGERQERPAAAEEIREGRGQAGRNEDAVDAEAGPAGERRPRPRFATTARRRGATYEGTAQLWQGDTTIKGDTIVIDSKTGDLTASGSVTTTTMLDQHGQGRRRKSACRSMGDVEGIQIRGRAAPRHLHRRRAHERPAGRHDRREDRAVSEAVGRRARARRGVRCRNS